VVVRLLCDRLRNLAIPDNGWTNVDNIVKPGNVIITSNWDPFVERYAEKRGVRLRLGGYPDSRTLTLIKLHGSVDWTEPGFRNVGYADADFAVLRELQNTPRRWPIQIDPDDMLRIRAVENLSKSWQFIKARTSRPHMIMMTQGKTVDVERIQSMWDDAYVALCAAREVRIIGYSLPDDDVEIRTLLRAGVKRRTSGQKSSAAKVIVHNPEPPVHVRVRTFVSRAIESDYGSFSPG